MQMAAAIVEGNIRLPQEKDAMDPRYPIGDFAMPGQVSPARRQEAIEEIAATPGKMRAAVKGLSDSQLDTPYRQGGWTVRQGGLHVSDRHLKGYVRLNLALTRNKTNIKPHNRAGSAELADLELA